jgi:uracil-DNA glycosylase family 4
MAVVGEAPGRSEDVEGRPFVGPSGELARGWVEPRFGQVAWVNAVSCFPNRTPTGVEVEACKENLWNQLRIIEPELLLVLGGIAMSAWVPGYRVGELRGRWVRCPIPGISVDTWGLITWHPAAVLRNRALELDVLDDLRVFRESWAGTGEGREGEGGALPPVPPYVYQPCVKCGSVIGTQVTKEGVAWCLKHWEWKTGKTGAGKPRAAKRGAKPKQPSKRKDRGKMELF